MPVLDVERLIQNRVTEIVALQGRARATKAQIDVSGGVDSAVVLGLLTRAVGPGNLIAVYSNIDSSIESRDRAEKVCDVFKVPLISLDLSDIHADLLNEILKRTAVAFAGQPDTHVEQVLLTYLETNTTVAGSLRSCLRTPVGDFMAKLFGSGIRYGTGNECEDRFLRFYQKRGDGAVDCNPIAMLSKGEVYQLALGLGVPKDIIDCMPTPDLWGSGDTHNDESELKSWTGAEFTYSRINSDTGEYIKTGSIERISRFLDSCWYSETIGFDVYGEDLFGHWDNWEEEDWPGIRDQAREFFPSDVSDEELSALLLASREAERTTRHKDMGIPTLGERHDLEDLEILTNNLSENENV